MRWAFAVFALCLTAGAQNSLPEEVLHLAHLRANVKAALAAMPDFVCLATTERFSSAKRGSRPALQDVIRLEVAHIGKSELYAWPGTGELSDHPPGELVQYGMFGSGAFAAHAQDVFLGGFASVHYVGPVEINGRRVLRWDYSIPIYGSGWLVSDAGSQASVGSAGSFWADPANDEVVRLEVRATGLPANFSMTAITRTMDYSSVPIGARMAWLPRSAEDLVEHLDGRVSSNRTLFSHCRQYSATATLSFDASPPAVNPTPGPARAKSIELPAGLRLGLELVAEVRSESAAIGEALVARLTADLRNGNELIARKGAAVRGRFRQMRRDVDPIEAFEVGLEFTEMDLPNGNGRFYASLASVDSKVTGFNWILSEQVTTRKALPNSGVVQETRSRIAQPRQIPGVGTFFMEGRRFTLPAGMRMTWITGDIVKSDSSHPH